MMGYYGMMGGFGWIGLIFNLVILIGIVMLIVWAVNRFSNGWNQSTKNQSPREILQARYARGEITREQYQQMMNDLG
jgi:putative membrane protein